MANRYWVGGAATWNATVGTKWATTSGGTGGASIPTSADDVFFDANSGTGVVGTTGAAICKSLNTTGSSPSLTVGSSNITVYGNITNPSGTAVIACGFDILASSTINIATAINVVNNANASININGAGITVTLGANLSFSGELLLNQGTFNADIYNCSFGAIRHGSITAKTLSMGSGTWTLTGFAIEGGGGATETRLMLFTGTNLTFNKGSANIVIAPTSLGKFWTFASNGLTFNNLTFGGSDSYIVSFTNVSNFNQISTTNTNPICIEFPASSTTSITTFSINGSAGKLDGIKSTVNGTTATLAVTNAFTANYLSVNSVSLSAANIGTVTNGYIQESTNWLLGSGSNYYQAVTSIGTSTFTTPSSWTNNNAAHLFGAGGGGSGAITNNTDSLSGGAGGGGGGYAKLTNLSVGPSSSINCVVGAGGTSSTSNSTSTATSGGSGGSTSIGISFNTISFIASTKTTTTTINKPTGTADGDLMVAFLVGSGGGSTNFSTITGWTSAYTFLSGGGGLRISIQYKTASSEGASYTLSGPGTISGYIATYRNAGFDAVGTAVTLTQNPTATSINVATNNSILFDLAASSSASTTYTTPSGFTSLDSNTTGNSSALFFRSANSGATGTVANTGSANTSTALLISISPSAAYLATANGGAGGSNTTTTSVGGAGGTATGGVLNYTGGTGGAGSVGTGGGTSSARGGGGGGGAAGQLGNGATGGTGAGSITTGAASAGGGGGATGGSTGGNATATLTGAGGNNASGSGGAQAVTAVGGNSANAYLATLGGGGSGGGDDRINGVGSISYDLISGVFGSGGGSGGCPAKSNPLANNVYGSGGGGASTEGRATFKNSNTGGQGLIIFTWGAAISNSGFFFFM